MVDATASQRARQMQLTLTTGRDTLSRTSRHGCSRASCAHEAWSSAPVMSAAGSTPSCVASRDSGPSSSSTVTCVISARFFTSPHDSPCAAHGSVTKPNGKLSRISPAHQPLGSRQPRRTQPAEPVAELSVASRVVLMHPGAAACLVGGNGVIRSRASAEHLRGVRWAEHAPLAGLQRPRAGDLARFFELGVDFGHHAQCCHEGQPRKHLHAMPQCRV